MFYMDAIPKFDIKSIISIKPTTWIGQKAEFSEKTP